MISKFSRFDLSISFSTNSKKRLRKNGSLEDYEDFLNYLRGLRLLMLRRLSTSVEEQASHDRQKEELDRKVLAKFFEQKVKVYNRLNFGKEPRRTRKLNS